MDLLIYLWYFIFPALGIILAFTMPIAFLLYHYKYMHKTARKLNKIIRKKKPFFFNVYDTGRAFIEAGLERRGEGIIKTDRGTYKILPRLPEKKDTDKDKNKNDPLTSLYSDVVLKRATLEDTGVPVFFGYSGKICLLNPDSLALAEMATHKPAKLEENEEPLLLLDPRKIKELITKSYSESQMLAVCRDTEEIMREQMGFSRYVFPLVGLMIMLFVVAVALKIVGVV